MNCQESQQLLHGYMDGELELERSLEIEQHLRDCTLCSQEYAKHAAVRTAIKESAPYFQAPMMLAQRIRTSIRTADESPAAIRGPSRWWLGIAASLCLGLIGGWSLFRALSPLSTETLLTAELVARHVNSQALPSHRVDVASSDQHTVKPWFAGKVDFAVPVKKLDSEGFELVGGRLDYVNNRSVAALVYQRRQHLINLFVWPATQASTADSRALTRQGFSLVGWTASNMTFWAVSDLNLPELEEFARLVQQ